MLTNRKSMDLCNGPLLKNIIIYTIPIILSGVLQTLFSTVNMIVVGRYCGSLSLGAIGAVSPVSGLLVALFLGISVGAGVAVSHSVGSRNDEEVSRVVHSAIPLSFVCSLILAVTGIIGAEYFLELINVPQNLFELSTIYMKIYFVGIVPSLIYNFGSAILRAAGDSQGPLISLIIGSVANILFSVIFVCIFNMDVAGAALSSVISQAVSAVLVINILRHRNDACKFSFRKMRFYSFAVSKILKVGIPAGITDSFFGISAVIIQASINSLGDAVVSGTTAAGNIEGFVYIATHAFYQTNMSFIGQNSGAGNTDRIKRVFAINVALVSVFSILLGVCCRIFGSQLLGLYITDSPEAIEYGLIRITVLLLPYILQGVMDVVIGGIIGLGSSALPMIISIISICGFRVVWIYTVFKAIPTVECLFACFPVSWALTLILQILAYLYVYSKWTKKHLPNSKNEEPSYVLNH